MRISYKIGLVGGIPIVVAAAIALFAWLLLNEAERARNGAQLAGSIYRNLLSAVSSRNDFVDPLSLQRDRDAALFYAFATQARQELGELATLADSQTQVVSTVDATDALARYSNRMGDLVAFTKENDKLVASIEARAAALISLTDQARARQPEQSGEATLNVAIATLKLSQRAQISLARRTVPETRTIVQESHALADMVASLPVAPLFRSEMVDALALWRNGLASAASGLEKQNAAINDMDGIALSLVDCARKIYFLFSADADRVSKIIRDLLVSGAAALLLLGAGTAYIVARSITRPLRRLQQRMMELAANPQAGYVDGLTRRDELGDMARAANFFVSELCRREQALRGAKDRADAALTELQRTQAELIRAEKLASLGGLVAGVAHEINTPLGIALTTATVLEHETRRFGGLSTQASMRRADLQRFVGRMAEGSRLLCANLSRAADLVHSFKQVSADQASGERRRFDMNAWMQELLTSLGPMLRKSGHRISIESSQEFSVDTYPGALAQVLTNLIMNSIIHAYDAGQAGHMKLSLTEVRPQHVHIVFADDGKGMAPEIIERVFDPFFTTGRSKGSTGLGLHIVYNLVTGKLQGKIKLESVLGKGTRFILDLPAHIGETAQERVLARTEG